MPRAIWISMPLITVIYVFANVAYFTVLSLPQLLQSNAVAVTFADKMLGVMAWCMPLFVAASTFGSLNAIIFTAARLAFVGAREGHLPTAVALINYSRFTPVTAIVITSMLSLIMLISKNVYVLINICSFTESVSVTLSVISLFVLRWSRPNMHRPIKVNLLLPIVFLLVMLFIVLFPLFYNATECIVALAIIGTGLPVYLLLVRWNKKPRLLRRFVAKATVFLQKLFLSVLQEKTNLETKDEVKTD